MNDSKSHNEQTAEACRQRLRRVVRELVAAEVANALKVVDLDAEARVKAARRAFNIALGALL